MIYLAVACSFDYARKVEFNCSTKCSKKTFSVPNVASVVNHLLDCVEALPLVWDVEGFKDMWEGCVVTTHPRDGSLQVEEALLLQTKNPESPSRVLQ